MTILPSLRIILPRQRSRARAPTILLILLIDELATSEMMRKPNYTAQNVQIFCCPCLVFFSQPWLWLCWIHEERQVGKEIDDFVLQMAWEGARDDTVFMSHPFGLEHWACHEIRSICHGWLKVIQIYIIDDILGVPRLSVEPVRVGKSGIRRSLNVNLLLWLTQWVAFIQRPEFWPNHSIIEDRKSENLVPTKNFAGSRRSLGKVLTLEEAKVALGLSWHWGLLSLCQDILVLDILNALQGI